MSGDVVRDGKKRRSKHTGDFPMSHLKILKAKLTDLAGGVRALRDCNMPHLHTTSMFSAPEEPRSILNKSLLNSKQNNAKDFSVVH